MFPLLYSYIQIRFHFAIFYFSQFWFCRWELTLITTDNFTSSSPPIYYNVLYCRIYTFNATVEWHSPTFRTGFDVFKVFPTHWHKFRVMSVFQLHCVVCTSKSYGKVFGCRVRMLTACLICNELLEWLHAPFINSQSLWVLIHMRCTIYWTNTTNEWWIMD